MSKAEPALDSLVILGGPPWQETANQTSLLMAKAFSLSVPTLYISRGDPRPVRLRLQALRNQRETADRPRRGFRWVRPDLAVFVLPGWSEWLPLVTPAIFRWVQLVLVRRAVREGLQNMAVECPGLISYWWMFPEVVKDSNWAFRIFDVIDRHWGYEYLNSRARDVNRQLAMKTATASDKVVAVSVDLANETAALSRRVVGVVPNVLDVDRVQRALGAGRGAASPGDPFQVVYAGGWNSRIDIDLVVGLVRGLPDYEFVFIGVDRIPELDGCHNVRVLGDLSYDETVRQIALCHVGIVPFQVDEYTRASSFLKVFDYLAAGVRVLSTALPAVEALVERYPANLTIADPARWGPVLREMALTAVAPVAITMLPTASGRAADLLAGLDDRMSTAVREAGRST